MIIKTMKIMIIIMYLMNVQDVEIHCKMVKNLHVMIVGKLDVLIVFNNYANKIRIFVNHVRISISQKEE